MKPFAVAANLQSNAMDAAVKRVNPTKIK